MSYSALHPEEAAGVATLADWRAMPMEPETPGFFSGMWRVAYTAPAAVAADLQNLPMAATGILPGGEARLASVRELYRSTRPDPATMGTAAKALHSILTIGAEAVAGVVTAGPAGGIALPSALQAARAMYEAQADGVSPGVSVGVGAITGLSTAASLALPMAPFVRPTLGGLPLAARPTNVAASAAAGVGQGVVTRGAMRDFLVASGYPEMAAQYQPFDSTAIAIDLVMGGVFGGVANYGPVAARSLREWSRQNEQHIMPSDRDTALSMNENMHRQVDTAPGIPTDQFAASSHADAITQAIEDLAQGRQVSVPESVTAARFIESPSAKSTRAGMDAALTEHIGDDVFAAVRVELAARGLPTDEALYSGTMKPVAEVAPPAPETAPYRAPRAEGAETDMGPIAAAEAVVNDRPDATVPDVAGNEQPARKALEDADAEVVKAQQDAAGIEAAAACALRG